MKFEIKFKIRFEIRFEIRNWLVGAEGKVALPRQTGSAEASFQLKQSTGYNGSPYTSCA
jgi:hypothetical protein